MKLETFYSSSGRQQDRDWSQDSVSCKEIGSLAVQEWYGFPSLLEKRPTRVWDSWLYGNPYAANYSLSRKVSSSRIRSFPAHVTSYRQGGSTSRGSCFKRAIQNGWISVRCEYQAIRELSRQPAVRRSPNDRKPIPCVMILKF